MMMIETPYGFQVGKLRMSALLEHKGGQLFMLSTGKKMVQVWVTPTGLIRVMDPTNVAEAYKAKDDDQ